MVQSRVMGLRAHHGGSGSPDLGRSVGEPGGRPLGIDLGREQRQAGVLDGEAVDGRARHPKLLDGTPDGPAESGGVRHRPEPTEPFPAQPHDRAGDDRVSRDGPAGDPRPQARQGQLGREQIECHAPPSEDRASRRHSLEQEIVRTDQGLAEDEDLAAGELRHPLDRGGAALMGAGGNNEADGSHG